MSGTWMIWVPLLLLAFALAWPVFFRSPSEKSEKPEKKDRATHGLPTSQAAHGNHPKKRGGLANGLMPFVWGIGFLLLCWGAVALTRHFTFEWLENRSPHSESTMAHVMAPRHDTGWSRAITDPSGHITAFFLCPAAGPEKACSDYNTDMAKTPFRIQCQKASGDAFLDWTPDGCRNIYAFRVSSKTDQPVRVGYWFERITE
jgi:hypothetical protein